MDLLGLWDPGPSRRRLIGRWRLEGEAEVFWLSFWQANRW
jgi:hypothetical protein